MGQAVGTNVSWKGGTDAFGRVISATNTVAQRQAYGFLNGTATMTALLDGNDMPVTLFGTNDNYRWQAQLSLVPGPHKLIVNALNWSGFYTASATNTFTNNALDHVQETYAGNGEVTNRVWITSGGKTNATQSLSFDAMDRLHSVTYLDTNNNGYIWSAVYDAVGRRMSTTTISVTNGIALSNLSKTIGQYYDPNVPFLELGESDSGNTVWKFYGPDVNGTYGGMQGVGGLQAVVKGPRDSSPMIYDLGGNELGIYVVSNSSTVLFPSRVTAYGAVPGYAPLPVADGALVGQSSAWRGKWPDITGFYYLGRRYYDPVAGNWLSADPLGHTADPSLYAFCSAGDPVNYFDPDGRISAQTANAQIPSTSDSGSYAENLASQLGINYIPQLPGESMSDYASRLGLSGGLANSPWAIAQASGSYALFSGIMNSGGVPDPDYQEVPSGGQWLVNAALNTETDYQEVQEPNNTTPWQLGWQWLTGTGPRVQNFTDGDPMTVMLQQHNWIQNTRNLVANNVANGGPLQGNNNYNLGGLQGVPKYFGDYSTLLTGGLTGNLAVTYLGSYQLTYNVTGIDAANGIATVNFQAYNVSSIASATHPPVIGYTGWWNQYIGAPLNNFFSTGPMSPTVQNFNWTENIPIPQQPNP